MKMIENINHFSFTVSDLSTAIRYYNKILGLGLLDVSERDKSFSEKVTGIKGAKLRIAYLSGKNCAIELIQYISPKGEKIDTSTSNIGSSHICFNISDFDGFVKMLKGNGVKVINEPQIIPAGLNKGRKVVYTEDPDNNTVELISVERYD